MSDELSNLSRRATDSVALALCCNMEKRVSKLCVKKGAKGNNFGKPVQ